MDSSEISPDSLKELGNKAVQEKKYTEAILHYTHAIKKAPNNYALYSNRSYAFLQEQQYYLALEDANETIRLCPTWPKGYFRKAEVEYAAQHYAQACQSYKKALDLQPGDIQIIEALSRASRDLVKDHRADETTPWLGAGIGLILGVCLMISDYLFATNPTHPILMSLVIIAIAMVGYGLARSYRYYMKCSKEGLLEAIPSLGKFVLSPIIGLDFGNEEETNENEIKTHTRYSKSQARQRYKKGKI